jgi:Fe-S-cluster containining protein
MPQLQSLRDQGVTCILNLCGEFCELHEIEAEEGFEVYYLPIEDEEAPDAVALEKALEWLDEAIYLGKKVLIHCRHGIGRTGTVLNAFLLRRGMGHRLSYRTMRNLKAKPSNFRQWWAVRKYGRTSPRLTIREPSLETRSEVNLAPFFEDYDALVQRVEEAASPDDDAPRCGREHARCCTTPVQLSLVEAVYLTHKINVGLASPERLILMKKAMERARQETKARKEAGMAPANAKKTNSRADDNAPRATEPDACLSMAAGSCPLLAYELCTLFPHRPLQCRLYDTPDKLAESIWNELVTPALDALSRDVFMAFAGTFPPSHGLRFSLPDVVSGRYVQAFFHVLLTSGKRS